MGRRQAVASVILLALASSLEAQTGLIGAAIQGTVRDAAGEPLAGATLLLTEPGTGSVRTASTDLDGRYTFAGLPLGTYRLSVEHERHRAVVLTGLVPSVGQVLVADVTLVLSFADSASADQESEATVLANAAVAAQVEARAIEGLPTNGRDYVAFTLLTPGVVAERTPPTGPTASSGLSFVGQRARSNHVMVDGFANDEVFAGAVAATFSQDAVREFEVLAASSSAEFGHASGGTVNTVTRSGTNELHGGAYLFLRDQRLNAREHFEEKDVFGAPVDAPKAPFHRQQWGATLGGPVRKDRTFFFLSYERLDTDASNFVTIDPGVASTLDGAGFPVGLGRAPFAAATDSALLKLEHGGSSEHRLLFRAHLSRRRDESVEPFGGIVARSHGTLLAREDWGVALARTDVSQAGWLSEARLQVVHGNQRVHGLDPRCGGPCETVDQGGPEITLSGLAVAGRQLNTPQDRSNLGLDLAETVTHSRGGHVLKAGLELDVGRWEATLGQDMGGRYVFTPLAAVAGLVPRPLTALEAFQQGRPALYVQGYGTPTGQGTFSNASAFVQDDWRLSRRWRLAAGLRYQRSDLGVKTVTVSAPDGGHLTYEVPARGLVAPRVALSFDPTGRGHTSLRAALGIFQEDPLLAIAANTAIFDGQLRLLQAGLPLSAQAWSMPGRRLREPSSPYASLVQVAGPDLSAPSSTQLSAGVTHVVGGDLHVSLDLVAVRGRNQIGIVDYNPLLPALGPGRRPNDVAGQPGTSASVNQFTNYGESSYRGLLVSVRKRMGARFEALVSYTLSSATDTGSDMFGQANVAEDAGRGRNPADPAGLPIGFAPDAFRGPSAVDQRHRMSTSLLATLPWRVRLSGIVTVGSGRPFTALSGVDSNGDGVAANDRARRNPADAASRVGRNAERMPGTATVDMRLSRTFALWWGVGLDLVAEGFNLLDRVNYSDVNNVFGTGAFPDEPQKDAAGRVTYGRYTKASPPRQVQLAVRVAF